MSYKMRCCRIGRFRDVLLGICFQCTGGWDGSSPEQTFKGAFSGGEIHSLRRLRIEGIPEILESPLVVSSPERCLVCEGEKLPGAVSGTRF